MTESVQRNTLEFVSTIRTFRKETLSENRTFEKFVRQKTGFNDTRNEAEGTDEVSFLDAVKMQNQLS